ncbi:hypothetical protein G4B88_027882 [Cannabis sativa]|uniref:Uncharacterized protein n=1 Tax=Cannabis sativa TaxID=3483 RepID=A0A7J6I7U3_CANSA|nr:hypothetical protein G4B88_027882 [Cannabis sativa]
MTPTPPLVDDDGAASPLLTVNDDSSSLANEKDKCRFGKLLEQKNFSTIFFPAHHHLFGSRGNGAVSFISADERYIIRVDSMVASISSIWVHGFDNLYLNHGSRRGTQFERGELLLDDSWLRAEQCDRPYEFGRVAHPNLLPQWLFGEWELGLSSSW